MARPIFRAKAPLRLGLGGGGSDIVDYSSQFGGAVINATISMYAHATLEPLDNGRVELCCADRAISRTYVADGPLEDDRDGEMKLLIGVYNRMMRDYAGQHLACRLTTYVDAPPGSGLGSSSTLVVAIIGVFAEWLRLPLGEYDIARLAYDIERVDLGLSGGKQDQFAATFGGYNFMEFNRDGSVLVNPLRIKDSIRSELEHCLLLLNTTVSRDSAHIIDTQKQAVQLGHAERIEALHRVKDWAFQVKKGLLTGDLDLMGQALHSGWENKKKSSDRISNAQIDTLYATALEAGARGGKLTGAGGGGFMLFYCPGNSRYRVMEALGSFTVVFTKYQFVNAGLVSWSALYD